MTGGVQSRIAIVDDDMAQCRRLELALSQDGHICAGYSSSRKFLNSFHYDTFDLLLLDWMMPELTGIEVLRHIRKVQPQLPVLMLTCRADDEDIIEGLKAGADDYVTKPVSDEVLAVRVEALLRRLRLPEPESDEVLTLGAYSFDPATSSAHFGGQAVVLTNREFALARLFFANPNRPLSRQYLLECLWGKGADLQTRTLDTHVARLRTKLHLGAQNGIKLNTLYAFGYRLEPQGPQGARP